MTASPRAQDAPVEIVGDGGSVGQTVRSRSRRLAPWLLLGGLLLAVVLIGFFGRSGQDGAPLSPLNPAPAGAMAVAEVLKNQGVEVTHAESLENATEALAAGPASGGTSLLLHDPDSWLDADQLASLGGLADRLILVEPNALVLRELAPEIRQAGLIPETEENQLDAGCDVDDAISAGNITAGGFAYRAEVMCFSPGTTAGPPSGSYAATAGQDIVVLGHGSILSNGLIEQDGNAALSLRTLGSTSSLIWYQPTAADLAVGDTPVDPLNLLPDWVNPVMLWLLGTAVLAALWRGRRLGRLVEEPLPVVVRAAETAEGRARLYQDSSSISRAADNLRAATLLRVATRLRLPPSSPVEAVIDAAARHSGGDPADLDRLLRTTSPTSDAQLVRWSQDLDALEKAIDAR